MVSAFLLVLFCLATGDCLFGSAQGYKQPLLRLFIPQEAPLCQAAKARKPPEADIQSK